MKNLSFSILISAMASAAMAQDEAPKTLFTNVNVFDGVNEERIENANVLVEGNLISSITTDAIDSEGATVIDGGGRTLMPGIVDNHTHLSMVTVPVTDVLFGDPSYALIRATRDAEEMLMRGVTTGRDMGGNIFGLKRAIDEGIVSGPRIFPRGVSSARPPAILIFGLQPKPTAHSAASSRRRIASCGPTR